MNSTMRRGILRALKDGDATVEALASRTSLDPRTVEWHLDILERGLGVARRVEGCCIAPGASPTPI